LNPKTTTCSRECTKIRDSGLTRDDFTRQAGQIDQRVLDEHDRQRAAENREITMEDLAEGRYGER